MMKDRLFTEEQLAVLARSPREEFVDLWASGRCTEAAGTLERLDAALRAQMERYEHWLAAVFRYVAERHPEPDTVALVAATRAHFSGVSHDSSAANALPSLRTALEPVLRGDRALDVGEAFDGALGPWRDLIDFHRDWISQLLSAVFRRHGPDELERLHRAVGEATLDALMADISEPPERRLERFAWLLKGHFSELTITEEPDRFVIDQDPCGTCGRQASDVAFGEPPALAMVAEPHLTSWGRGDTTIYRSHVPVWHVAMAMERIGVPWPVNQCPSGATDAPCRILLFKDPVDAAALDEVPGTIGRDRG